MVDRFRTLYLSWKYGIEIGAGSKICKNVEIKMTRGGIFKIGKYVTIADHTFIQLTKPSPDVRVGNFTVIGRNCVIASKTQIRIGAYTLIGPYCQINDQSHGTARNQLIINQAAVLDPVTIGDDVWLGSGVRVMPGVTIGDGAIVGAGSVVTRNIPQYEIWGGNPERFIRTRE